MKKILILLVLFYASVGYSQLALQWQDPYNTFGPVPITGYYAQASAAG